MKVDLKIDKKSYHAIASIKSISSNSKKGIRNAFYKIGVDLKKTAIDHINFTPKSGRQYIYYHNGKKRIHVASAPGEPPANFRGNLRKSVGYKLNGSSYIVFGAGNSKVKYARRLELGGSDRTRGGGSSYIAPRPFIIRSINDNERNITQHFENEISILLKK